MKQLVETYKEQISKDKDKSIFFEDFFLIGVVQLSTKDILLYERITSDESSNMNDDYIELNNSIMLTTATLALMIKGLRDNSIIQW